MKLKSGMDIRAQVLRVANDTVFFTNVGQEKVLKMPAENVITISYGDGRVEYPNRNHPRSPTLNRTLNLRFMPFALGLNHLAVGCEVKFKPRTSFVSEAAWIGLGATEHPEQGGAVAMYVRRYYGLSARQQPEALRGMYVQGGIRLAGFNRYYEGNSSGFFLDYSSSGYFNQVALALLVETGSQMWLTKKVSLDVSAGIGYAASQSPPGGSPIASYNYGYIMFGGPQGVAFSSRIAFTWNLY
jgi:hypothetical protein